MDMDNKETQCAKPQTAKLQTEPVLTPLQSLRSNVQGKGLLNNVRLKDGDA